MYHKIFVASPSIEVRAGMKAGRRTITSIAIITLLLSLLAVGGYNAYAINYRPVEFIYGADGVNLQFPFGIVVDNEGRVIVSDTAAQKIYIFKKIDGDWRLLGSFDRRSAVDLGIDGYGNLVVLTHVHPEGAIYIYKLTYDDAGMLSNAEIISELQSVEDGNVRFMFPHGLAAYQLRHTHGPITMEHNLIFIGDNNSKRVQVYEVINNRIIHQFSFDNQYVYDASGNQIGSVGGEALNSSILDVKVLTNHNNTKTYIIVAYKIGVIGVYSMDYMEGTVSKVLNIGAQGIELGYFNEPRGVAYDRNNDYLTVSDNLNHRLQVFKYSELSDGINEPVFYYGSGIAGSEERQLNTPRKIVLHDNKLYVADGSNGRIVVLTLDESIPSDVDQPRIEPLEPSQWYRFSNHREMFELVGRLAYTKMHEQGVDEYVATRTALEIPAKALEYVLLYIRTLPADARLNIPWESSFKGDLKIVNDVIFNAGCTIGKPGSTGINDPREYHDPPVLVGDTLYCGTMAIVKHGSDSTIGVNSVTAYFIDPDGMVRGVYYVDSNGFHTGINNMPIDSSSRFFYLPFAIDIDKEGTWTLLNKYSNEDGEVTSIEIEFYVGSTYSFNNSSELLASIGKGLSNAGLSDSDVATIINSIDVSQLPDQQGTITLNIERGSAYTLGIIMPHDPPLNPGEQIQVLVLYASLGSPVTINDLHVYAITPSGNTVPIQDWNWYPSTIPDPFFWISNPITVDEPGAWQIISDFTTNDGQTSSVVLTVESTFGVIPESIIGALGVVGSSLAVLAYKLRRR